MRTQNTNIESNIAAIRETLGLEDTKDIPPELDKNQFQLDQVFIEQSTLKSLVDTKVTVGGFRSNHICIKIKLP